MQSDTHLLPDTLPTSSRGPKFEFNWLSGCGYPIMKMLTDRRRRHRFTMGSPAEKVERNISLYRSVKLALILLQQKTVKLAAIFLQQKTVKLAAILPQQKMVKLAAILWQRKTVKLAQNFCWQRKTVKLAENFC